MTSVVKKNVIITDLDHSDQENIGMKIIEKKGTNKRKLLKTLSGNFNRRSRSAEATNQQRGQHNLQSGQSECTLHKCSKEKAQTYLNDLLLSKDAQMEKLLQRLATLHKYNDQFAEENQQLQKHATEMQQRIDALRQQITNCGKCQRLSKQLDATVDAQKTYEADITMLKTLVYRLNVQIEAYQDQLRLTTAEKSNSHEFLPKNNQTSTQISQWQHGVLATHTLAPLLTSYDEMLRDKDELIQQYRQEFEHFTGELKRSLEENNRLLQQHETLKRDFGGWREERTRLHAQLDVCRSKVDAQSQKSDLAKEKLVEVMHCYEQKVQTLVLDLEHTQSAYIRCKTELASLKSLTAQPQDTIAQSLQDCKSLLEELKQQHSKEKQTFECNIHELEESKRTLEKRCDELGRENGTLRAQNEQNNIGKAELEKRCADMQHTVDVVKQSRDRLKARLRIALQWAQRLEEGQTNIQNTWDALKRLETIVKHKESQVRGLHTRHIEEIDKMERKLAQKDETIRTILKGKLGTITTSATDVQQ